MTPHPAEPAEQYVLRLSREKSAAVSGHEGLIITADTTVADGPDILGKPADAAEATTMLRRLRGRVHRVHTGVTLRDTQTGRLASTVTTTSIHMRDYSDAEIDRYIRAGEPFDKAGSYGIQHAEFHPVDRLEGCYANVMGLPLCTLCAMLAESGISIPKPVSCNAANGPCDLTR
jgi:MAF protein